jgi:hypothetical protein
MVVRKTAFLRMMDLNYDKRRRLERKKQVEVIATATAPKWVRESGVGDMLVDNVGDL